MLNAAFIAIALAVAPLPAIKLPEPATDMLIAAAIPDYKPDTHQVAEGKWVTLSDSMVRVDGTALLVVVIGPENNTGSTTQPDATLYSLRKSGKAWKVVDEKPLQGALPQGFLSASVGESPYDLGGGVHPVEATVGSQSDGEASMRSVQLFAVGKDGKLAALLSCDDKSCLGDGYPNDHSTCQLKMESGGKLRRTVRTESCDDPEKECTTASEETVFKWNGSSMEELHGAEAEHEKLVKAATASSTLVEKGLPADYYVPAKAFDEKEKTAWAEGVAGPGVGSWIKFEFARPVKLARLELLAGCGATPARRKLNERLKTVKLTADGDATQTVTLRDVMVSQDVALKLPKPTSSLKLEVVEIYPGTKFQDACLSEIRFIEVE